MTAVEWLASQLGKHIIWEEKIIDLVEQAKEMEKQMVIDIVEKSRATGLTAEYLLLTYGSKESDTPQDTPQVTPQVTSSQIEITNEEIAEKAEEFELTNGVYGFKHGVKWYREQLKQRQ